MRRFTALCLFLLATLAGQAQSPTTLDGWAERLRLFGEKIPQEEVFLHTDNSCYYLGDTLYFKAYMRLSDGRPSSLSRLLYVELLNQDGYLVERQKVEMKQGQGWGAFCLPDTLYGGYYELRAYTRWQLNWGQYEHGHTKNAERWFLSNKMMHEYYRDYDKLYSRVFPVYDKPREPGDYAQDMTTRPLRRVYKVQEKSRAVVKCYPEGGSLIAGVPNRVAFEANDEEGRHLKGKVRITRGKTGTASEAETVNRGRGSFVVTPADGEQVKGIFEWEGGSQAFDLPKAVPDGVALQATVEADGLHVRLMLRGRPASEPLGLTASCHGVLKDFRLLTEPERAEAQAGRDGAEPLEVLIPLAQLGTGVIQLTVFNAEGYVYADRLVFVRQPDFQPQNITFGGLKEKYEPYEEVRLTLQTLSQEEGVARTLGEGQGISLAVRDAAHSDYTFDGGNILTEMLLSSQIRGFVEQPEYYFEADDEERRMALDLLLLVQGWRRYDWVEMATPGAFILSQPYEHTEVLLGEVSKYDSEQQANGIMEAMDALEAAYQDDQDYLSKRMSTLQGEDASSVTEAEAGTQTQETMQGDIAARFSADDTHQGTTQRTSSVLAESRYKKRYRGGNRGSLSKEVLVHAEFLQPGVRQGESAVVGDMDTYSNGLFRIEAPKFYEACYFSYDAVDKARWKGDAHVWTAVSEDRKGYLNYPDYYVKLTPPYPRFVKPYSYYQTTLPAARVRGGRPLYVDDDAILLSEVTVGSHRRGLRRFDASKPAFVVDAYEAFNEVCDAGFCPGYFIGANRFMLDIARTYVGDMNMERPYDLEQRFDTKNQSSFISAGVKEKYNHLPNLDKVYVYTDYSPRQEGDRRYAQENQPLVTVDLRRFEDESQRMTWRNRRMVLTGFAVCEEFYRPDYSRQTPSEPTDYRRTLYWNPNVPINSDGMGEIHFFTGSRPVQFVLSAEGMTATGEPLTGIRYPDGQ